MLHGDPAAFVGRGLEPSGLAAPRPQRLGVDPENVERGLPPYSFSDIFLPARQPARRSR